LTFDLVTGAFSYTGKFIAVELQGRGRAVRTLSRSPAPATSPIEARPLQFAESDALVDALRGAETLYNTYWIRFERGASTFARAVANTRTLFAAACDAGVRKIVHVSVTNPSHDSPYPYFRGKAVLEDAVRQAGIAWSIVRPTLIFGPNDILVNNIAWLLRRFPAFVVPGRGEYRVQPVSVRDVARICVEAGDGAVVDAAGPETLAFDRLVRLVRGATRSRTRVVHWPPPLVLALARAFDALRRDVLLTRDELRGLTDELLVSHEPPLGSDVFSEWVERNGDSLGTQYVAELARNFRHAPL
jgi:uncharacterized protein YbjT (DUF2867 family)